MYFNVPSRFRGLHDDHNKQIMPRFHFHDSDRNISGILMA